MHLWHGRNRQRLEKWAAQSERALDNCRSCTLIDSDSGLLGGLPNDIRDSSSADALFAGRANVDESVIRESEGTKILMNLRIIVNEHSETIKASLLRIRPPGHLKIPWEDE